MSVEIWPSLPPEQLITAIDQTQTRELQWLLNELHDNLQSLKHGLEDCYALLAPIDPGSTLVVSTHRNETVKGHITRVGTRIVKGTLTLKMKTQPPQTYAINPDNPIQLAPLAHLHALLTESIDLLTLTTQYTYTPPTSTTTTTTTPPTPSSPPPSPARSTATFVAAQLRLLSQSLAEASSLLRGPQPLTASDATWVSKSCSPDHFRPRPGAGLSLHWGVQESQLVLWLRALEPAAAPVNLGLKLALAIGTARRLEHDEAEQVFMYTYPEGAVPPPETAAAGAPAADGSGQQRGGGRENNSSSGGGGGRAEIEAQVFVREKVRVESADPALMSLGTKLTALATTLSLARGNLAVVMGEDPEW